MPKNSSLIEPVRSTIALCEEFVASACTGIASPSSCRCPSALAVHRARAAHCPTAWEYGMGSQFTPRRRTVPPSTSSASWDDGVCKVLFMEALSGELIHTTVYESALFGRFHEVEPPEPTDSSYYQIALVP